MKTCAQCHLRYPNESTFCFVDGQPLVPLTDPRVGSTIAGRYVIEDVIGEGGMAIVYRARHKLVDKPCAVKILSPGLSRDPVVRERFRREAKAAQKLAHPNIIEILDQGDTDDGNAYIVMELLEGEVLSRAIERGPIPCERAMSLMIQIARALARAHDFEVIHRDLKPDNIFLCRRSNGTDLVKLLDFGIARSMQDARLTGAGEVFGTPQYMAPERITSIDAGASSDLYSVGVVFFEMVAGQPPFEAQDVTSYFLKHLREKPPRVRSLAPDLPESLETLIQSLLAKDPHQRPVDAHRMHKDLIAISEELGLAVPPEPDQEEQPASSFESLPPVAIDQWTRRVGIFERMLAAAYPAEPPAELVMLLDRLTRTVGAIADLRQESRAEQHKIEGLQARGREGRLRFGFAVDALGVDVSRARDAARGARDEVVPLASKVEETKSGFVEAHREIVFWEGRSAFAEPYADLASAYQKAGDAVNVWLKASKEARAATEVAEARDRELADLEFQIHELRNGLAKLEHDVETELGEIERRVAELDARSESMQVELLAMAARFCGPLRRRPELGGLFQELEGGAVAA